MIGIIFEQLDGKYVEIRLEQTSLTIRSMDYGKNFFPVKSVFNYQRCVKMYPEIEGHSGWRDTVDKKLKKKLKSLLTEQGRFNYIRKELERQGFRYIAHQREGHRIKKDGKF